MERTLDPQVVIEERSPDHVVYRHVGTGERWIMRGVCSRCGECELGASNPDIVWLGPVGTPGACVDLAVARGRPDNVVRPEYSSPNCTLRGEYL